MATAKTTRRRRQVSDEEAKQEAEAKPMILTAVRMDMPDGGPAEIFNPGQEDDFIEFLDEMHGDGQEATDTSPAVKSKDEVLAYLTRKGYIVNFDVDEDVLENAQSLTIDQQMERRWKRQKQEQEENGGEATEEQLSELEPRSTVNPARGRRGARGTGRARNQTTESDDGTAGNPEGGAGTPATE